MLKKTINFFLFFFVFQNLFSTKFFVKNYESKKFKQSLITDFFHSKKQKKITDFFSIISKEVKKQNKINNKIQKKKKRRQPTLKKFLNISYKKRISRIGVFIEGCNLV